MPATTTRCPRSGPGHPTPRGHAAGRQRTDRAFQPLGATRPVTKYDSDVSDVLEYQVSSSGQMSLPATARHRWHLDHGGPVDVIDLGFGVLTVPRGQGRRLLGDVLSRDDHAAFVASLADDPDLATT
jgi:hypothetical protein